MNMFRAFMELDEAYNDRQYFINELKKAGKNYNFNKYTDAQLYCMWQKLPKQPKITKEPKHDLDLDFEPEQKVDCCDECGTRLTDFGQCPICDLGEEDLDEWVDTSGKKVNVSASITASQPAVSQQTPKPHLPSGRYAVRIVSHGGRLRALATDGVHPAAFVAFPNNLRQFEGQLYEVDQLIWNGKNYRVAGNIVEV